MTLPLLCAIASSWTSRGIWPTSGDLTGLLGVLQLRDTWPMERDGLIRRESTQQGRIRTVRWQLTEAGWRWLELSESEAA